MLEIRFLVSQKLRIIELCVKKKKVKTVKPKQLNQVREAKNSLKTYEKE